jgi:hypothetical protein
VRGPERNGLDGELYFSTELAAAGATNHVDVARTDGDRLCIEGKGGEACPSSDRLPIAIDTASCGDGCTATIQTDDRGYPYVDVTATSDVELAVDVHALDGSGAWHDRFIVPFRPVAELRIVMLEDGPLGVAYAAEVGASAVVYACALPPGSDECLRGTYAATVTGEGVVEVAAAPPLDYDNGGRAFTRIHLAAPGTGKLHISALGIDRAIAMRAADPSEWTEVRFARYDFTASTIALDATGFLGIDVPAMRIPENPAPYSLPIVATAILADGSRALIPAAQVVCTPAERVVLRTWSANPSAWRGLLDLTDYLAPSPGDATCVVAGHAELGALQIHVD